MNVAERQVGDVTIIDLQGSIMFEDGDQEFRSAVARALESGSQKLILNMAEVPYVDSAGLSEPVRGSDGFESVALAGAQKRTLATHTARRRAGELPCFANHWLVRWPRTGR